MFTRRITHRSVQLLFSLLTFNNSISTFSNHLGSQGIIINTAPASSLHARAAPKASSTFRAAGIGSDLKTDATKFDDKLNVRSSRSKSKGIEDVESTQLITEDPESICVPSLKRPSARSTDANGMQAFVLLVGIIKHVIYRAFDSNERRDKGHGFARKERVSVCMCIILCGK